MIPVAKAPEPAAFDAAVRRPGLAHLSSTQKPNWRKHAYWRRAIPDLAEAYSSICCYSGIRIHDITGFRTVDHFHPKDINPPLAYEWGNLRLACGLLNSRKGKKVGFIDPFDVKDGWFALGFPSLLVIKGPNLPEAVIDSFDFTVKELKLNGEDTVQSRERYVKGLCCGHVTIEFLRSEAPFVAAELERQGLVDSITDVMGYGA